MMNNDKLLQVANHVKLIHVQDIFLIKSPSYCCSLQIQ